MNSESDVHAIDFKSPEACPSNARNTFGQQPLPDRDLFDDAAPAKEHASASWTPCRDSRKSSRSSVPQERQVCELSVGSKRTPALLLNESPQGFAVLIDSLDGLKTGKRGQLHTGLGWFKVRIIYANKAASPANSDPNNQGCYRLGLKKARSFRLF